MVLRGKISTTSDLMDWQPLGDGEVLVPSRVTMKLTGPAREPDSVVEFELRDGRPDCVSFTVTAKADGRGLRTSDLAMINIDSIAEAAFVDFAVKPDGSRKLGGAEDDDDRERWELRRGINEAIATRSARLAAEVLEDVARIYQAADRAPREAVADALGVSLRTASRRITEAREAGLL